MEGQIQDTQGMVTLIEEHQVQSRAPNPNPHPEPNANCNNVAAHSLSILSIYEARPICIRCAAEPQMPSRPPRNKTSSQCTGSAKRHLTLTLTPMRVALGLCSLWSLWSSA